MNCRNCKSALKKFHANGSRKVKTLHGEIYCDYIVYKCLDCGKFFRTEIEEAPFNGHWGWDVIEKLGELFAAGKSYEKIHIYFIKHYKLKLSFGTINGLYKRWIVNKEALYV